MSASTASAAVVATPELRLERISKVFGRVQALDGASLTVRPGSVQALLGENGAGKTTLMRVAFGMVPPDSGRILLNGRETAFRSPAQAIAAGIGMVHQHFTNVAAMTVAENIALGGHGLYSRRTIEERARDLSEQTQLSIDPEARVEWLNVGAQQKLEILKALARDARILILDEPTAVLAPAETCELLAWLRGFARGGGAVVLITHKLAEALAVADEVTVLRYGHSVFSSPASRVSAEKLATAMLGSAPPPRPAPAARVAPGEIVLRVSALSVADARGILRIADANLEVGQHEIVGIAAIEDSGHELLLRAIADRVAPNAGTVTRAGSVALIPEDRDRDALVLGLSLAENIALKGAGQRRGRMNWHRFRQTTRDLIEAFDVRAPSVDAPAGALSGGNQQKLVLARELSDDPAIIVAENPTRGLDIRGTAAVHDRLRNAAARGAAVIVYSSDLDEVLSLATRVVAIHEGRLMEVPNDREVVGRAMLGLA